MPSSRSSSSSACPRSSSASILIPTIGNLAEHLVAVQLALKDKMEFAMAVTYGSSLQVALFVAPVLVLSGVVVGQPMDLVFTPLEVAAVAAAVGIIALISLDGESNWLEGALLMSCTSSSRSASSSCDDVALKRQRSKRRLCRIGSTIGPASAHPVGRRLEQERDRPAANVERGHQHRVVLHIENEVLAALEERRRVVILQLFGLPGSGVISSRWRPEVDPTLIGEALATLRSLRPRSASKIPTMAWCP